MTEPENPTQEAEAKAAAKTISEKRKKGEVKEAIEYGKEWLKTHPHHPRVLCALGSAYINYCNHTRARESFEKALALNPQDSVALVGLGVLKMGQRKYTAAQKFFEDALAITPDQPYALVSLGKLEVLAKHVDKARALFARALEAKADDIAALTSLASLDLSEGNISQARAYVATALEKHPENTIAQFLEACILLKEDKLDVGFQKLVAINMNKFDKPSMVILKSLAENGVDEKSYRALYQALKVTNAVSLGELKSWELGKKDTPPSKVTTKLPQETDEEIAYYTRSKVFGRESVRGTPIDRTAGMGISRR